MKVAYIACVSVYVSCRCIGFLIPRVSFRTSWRIFSISIRVRRFSSLIIDEKLLKFLANKWPYVRVVLAFPYFELTNIKCISLDRTSIWLQKCVCVEQSLLVFLDSLPEADGFFLSFRASLLAKCKNLKEIKPQGQRGCPSRLSVFLYILL